MPNSSSEQPFTLFTSLTAPRDNAPPDFPVSELIRHLIVATGYEVCSPSYPRFTLASYQFLTQARDIRDHINRLINKVENSVNDEESWALFDEYSDLIDPTEKYAYKKYHFSFVSTDSRVYSFVVSCSIFSLRRRRSQMLTATLSPP
jgi:hypothetical protein